ncbi:MULTISPECIES: hypothetical protein [Bradyrhizobium]|uniref:hypothetical protein n=1 Tax=Bradyrhizobium TaxID=374 RepID=UPI001EDC653C|nr:hypothetical protein [Bradyrhizobium zhengyangense]MCG2645714.1 hypothetical protein [Bradyrhizobium zhengyangense]
MACSDFQIDTNPITGAALVGGAAIAGALAAGIANYRAAQLANWDRFEADQLRDFLRSTELFRARDQILMAREMMRLTRENERLHAAALIVKAQRLPR